jgi:hypothetical protein
MIGCRHQYELGPTRVIPLFRSYIGAHVNNFLELHWSPISAIAHLLIRKQRVSRKEAEAARRKSPWSTLPTLTSSRPRVTSDCDHCEVA